VKVAIALFEAFTALDALGPYQVFANAGYDVHFVAEAPGQVADYGRLRVEADLAFAECTDPDIVVVPGGLAAIELARRGGAPVEWVRAVHATTTWTTSVCTGAFILGAAGLLKDVRATTHWFARQDLGSLYAARVEDARYVFDGRIATSAGVSAGIDMALALAGRLEGETMLRLLTLDMEYAPEPPVSAGTPETAGPEATAHLTEMYATAMANLRAGGPPPTTGHER
jgi:transcriptional regulator GlxA family with amidase domain